MDFLIAFLYFSLALALGKGAESKEQTAEQKEKEAKEREAKEAEEAGKNLAAVCHVFVD